MQDVNRCSKGMASRITGGELRALEAVLLGERRTPTEAVVQADGVARGRAFGAFELEGVVARRFEAHGAWMPASRSSGPGPTEGGGVDLGEGVVAVDALAALGARPKRRDPRIAPERDGDVSDDVLDEDRVVIGLHRDLALVSAFQDRVHATRCRLLRHRDQLLAPHLGQLTTMPAANRHLHRDGAALIVRPVVADGLAAWTQGRHRSARTED